tara:strand:- start:261 stop:413 length:153 start_codon:yes stop_codon:yes gene_type:complete
MTGNKESESQALEVGKFVAFIIISSPLMQNLQYCKLTPMICDLGYIGTKL